VAAVALRCVSAALRLAFAQPAQRLGEWGGEALSYNREVPVHGMLMASGNSLATPLAQALRRLRESQPQRS